MIVEGKELRDNICSLFSSKKSFISEVKLVDSDIWLNLSAGPMSDDQAIIVATDIQPIFLKAIVSVTVNIYYRYQEDV